MRLLLVTLIALAITLGWQTHVLADEKVAEQPAMEATDAGKKSNKKDDAEPDCE